MSSGLSKQGKWVFVVVAIVGVAGWALSRPKASPEGAQGASKAASSVAVSASSAVKAALSVQVVLPQLQHWPSTVISNGSIAAWQDAVIGAELSGLRLATVLANVGDRVARGQTLATLQVDSVMADLNTSRANLAEGQALLVEAKGNADRARTLRTSEAISAQEAQRSTTAEQTAQARVDALRARLAADELRLRQTRVVAADDGVISSRLATVGSVVQPGQELFRLIRQSRLEWRAELPAAELQHIKPGMVAWATPAGGAPVQGRVRAVAPTIDATSRNGLVYVDLPANAVMAGARAGSFAQGYFEVGEAKGLTLPQSAVLLRDGFSYVFKVSAKNTVTRLKVAVGRRVADRVEIAQGLDASARVVASGVSFLADGDTVLVVKGQP